MHVVIIGNGIAGVTAARHLRKRDSTVRITMVSGESEHHWARTALMYIYMGHMQFTDTKPYPDHFWKKNRIELMRGWVSLVETEAKTIRFEGGRTLSYDKLLIATGSRPNRFGWPGEELQRVSGMYSVQDLARLEAASPGLRHAAVIGGGLIGIELAEMLHSRGIRASMLVRESSYFSGVLPDEESQMVNQVILEQGIDLQLSTNLTEILDDGQGQACAIINDKGERIEVGFVGLCAGVSPNVAFLDGSGIEVNTGIVVDSQLRTNTADVFAIGDCAEIREPGASRGKVTAVWYTGRMMGETVAENLLDGVRDYDPGIWFNSAKFFDLEYQVYGEVPAARSKGEEEPAASLLWMAPEGRQSVRIVHRNGAVIGFNLMGTRYRHTVCESWIREQRSIEYVLKHLKDAHFDPEFSRRWTREIQQALEASA
jgi:3-phenylpropionate/trans-cinnamate dioxygenase ferredoxin reductase component